MNGQLFTIGYENASPEAFRAVLQAAGVRLLLDVREAPVSRRPGFSKRALASALQETGIGYVNLRALGTPKPGREAARRGDREGFEHIFLRHLATDEALAGLDEAARLARKGGICLMCLEREPALCHRSVIAARLSDRLGLPVRHLFAS